MPGKIADSELEVMRILWREKRSLSFSEIRKELERTRKWSKSTIQTLITRLRDKEAISARQSQTVTLFSPAITEQEYRRTEEQNFLDKLYGGSAKNLLTEFCRDGKLSEKDIDELKAFFQMGDDKK